VTHEPDPFRAVYDANHPRIHRLLARIVGAQNAEDLTQAVFAKAAKALPGFRGDAQASTWLYRIAINEASDWLRSRAAHEAKVTDEMPAALDREMSDAGAALVEQASPEQMLARKEIADVLRAEIGRLPDPHRDVLMLSALGGLSDDEVAASLDISLGNAKVRLHRARAELKKAIGARCDFYRLEFECAPSSAGCCASVEPAAPSGRTSGRASDDKAL
jgi:RNA polymerase sigma-70 factor (ECF subfamily)